MNTFSNNSNSLTSNEPTFIGIDVAKDSVAVFIDSTQTHLECRNKPKDLTKLAQRFRKLNPQLIVLEATGGYETQAALVFAQFELPFAIVYPKRVRQFARGLGILAKTDKIDAKMISYYGKVAKVESRPLQSDELRQLQALTKRRSQLIEMRLIEENRLETAPISIKPHIKKHLTWLLKQIKLVETELDKQIQESVVWQETARRLQTVPGVGAVLSQTLITLLPELGQISNKEIAALVGVAPFTFESGKHKGKSFCYGGRNQIRRVLYMATLCATRCNPIIKEFYQRLVRRGKQKKVALIACARKLLCILNAMVRNQTTWQAPNKTNPA